MFKKLICILCSISCLYSHSVSFAQNFKTEYLVKAPDISKAEYMGIVQSRPQWKQFVELQEAKLVQKQNRELLRSQFIQAQNIFLNQPKNEAMKAWEAITLFQHQEDWQEAERLIIVIAYLRLAQMATQNEEIRQFLEKAAQYSPELNIEPDLFPPPLMKLYDNMKQSVSKLKIPVKNWDQYDVVYIDGKKQLLNNKQYFYASPGFHRFHFLSNQRKPLLRITTTEQLTAIEPNESNWLQGNCSQPISNLEHYSNEATKWVFAECVTDELDSLKPKSKPITHLNITERFTREGPTEPKFYEKSSFWYTSAFLVLAGLIIHKQTEERSPQPGSKEGW